MTPEVNKYVGLNCSSQKFSHLNTRSTYLSEMDKDILKTALQHVAEAMDSAIGNIGDVPKSNEPSDFLKQYLSVEDTTVQDNVDYVEPMQDPYQKAIMYLEHHSIMQMFQQLTASIVYTKPEKPLEFMMKEVERMKQEKESEVKDKEQGSS